MGEWWKRDTGLPLPLGGNVVRRDLGPEVVAQVAKDVRASVEYALAHRGAALSHASQYSRGLSDDRTDRFVGMYVNEWTVDYGPVGPPGRAGVARPRGGAWLRAPGRRRLRRLTRDAANLYVESTFKDTRNPCLLQRRRPRRFVSPSAVRLAYSSWMTRSRSGTPSAAS